MTLVMARRAKTDLSKLVIDARAGADVVIAARHVPVARTAERRFGAMNGTIARAASFHEPLGAGALEA